MKPRLITSVALVVLTSAGCAGAKDASPEFRIYDPTGRSGVEVLAEDIKAAELVELPGSNAALAVHFTKRGENRFRTLTRAIAHDGARRQRPQWMFVAIDGEVVSRVRVDFREFPDGIDGRQGIEFQGLPLSTAIEFVHRMQNG